MSELHQVLAGASTSDAVTDQALLIQGWLRARGHKSHLYARHVAEEMLDRVRPFHRYRPGRNEPLLIYHHSTGFPGLEERETPPLLLIYHNITPPGFFQVSNPAMSHLTRLGMSQLTHLASRTRLALADSGFNELDLQQAGFAETDVLPIAVDPTPFQQPVNEALLKDLTTGGPVLLFVGRIVPNKRQEDVIKLLHAYRQIRSDARAILVGTASTDGYLRWLERLAEQLGLADAVTFTGRVSVQDLITYYRGATLYVSMSEHEGFGKPLIESMLADLPVLAYGSSAVPWTMGSAGVIFHHKAYARLAELVEMVVADADLRRTLIAGQRKRAELFLAPNIEARWNGYLNRLGLP